MKFSENPFSLEVVSHIILKASRSENMKPVCNVGNKQSASTTIFLKLSFLASVQICKATAAHPITVSPREKGSAATIINEFIGFRKPVLQLV